MKKLKSILRQFIPKSIFSFSQPIYHGFWAKWNAKKYGYPAKKLRIIAVTGTKGKTTTTVLIGRLLNLLSYKTGYISTGIINIDGLKEYTNPHKMTTLNSRDIQKYLKKMVLNKCQFVVIELSSQGLHQNRHLGLGKFETGLFLNIYPEHIESHGTFENYLKSKGILFKNIQKNGHAVINGDSNHADEISKFVKYKSIQISSPKPSKQIQIQNTNSLEKSFIWAGKNYKTNFIANFEIINLFFAIQSIAKTLANNSAEETKIMQKLAKLSSKLKSVAGRMDWAVKNGKIMDYPRLQAHTNRKISILVDYAHEPQSMTELLQTISGWKPDYFNNIIHVVSCDGAGRDDWKKPIMGEISYKYADISILTTDNYDKKDNPNEILKMLSSDIVKKQNNKKYYQFINRRSAFLKALELAKEISGKVLIVSTGVGTEQGLTQPKGTIKWDEKQVWKSLYQKSIEPKLLN
jgi:UDP-N-acetylmuramoyl-L-alanyl-D-glutamate--2,6-diaminopimelate ligase